MDVVEKIVSTVRGWNETKTPEARLVNLQEGKKVVGGSLRAQRIPLEYGLGIKSSSR